MEAYANALLIAIPAFMILMLTELIYGCATGEQTYVFMDTISSLSSGLTNILKDTLGLVVILISYPWLSQQLAITQIEADLWLYLAAFICIDFASYWSHRLNHKINFFWNSRLPWNWRDAGPCVGHATHAVEPILAHACARRPRNRT